ncbi:MAG: spermidine/putrescine ABC transporter substrate-binding protein [Eubacterium sp.]|nr:spermidine/putrescine ABC transporter substrate-binding protein [Eubacterium sp.]
MRSHRGKKALVLALALLAALFITLLTACDHSDEKEVRVYCYGDYMDPAVIDGFEKETGIKVILDTYDTVEEMYPVIKNRAGVYDVLCPSDYMVERMIAEDLLAPLHKANLPHLKNIGKRYLTMASQSYDPGNRYAVPYQWGTMGIMYNSKTLAGREPSSWNDLWDPSYSGSILMQDSMRDTMGASLKAQGLSINSTRKKDLNAAAEYLIRQKPLVYKYANDSARDLLIGNSANLGVVWNGEVLYSQELNRDLDFVIPKEGTEVFIDNWVIPAGAFHPENAEKFIDYMCRGDVAYTNYEYLTYSTPNEAARAMLPKSLQNSPVLFPSDELLARSEVLRDLGPEGNDLVTKYWKKFKAE